MTIDQIKGEIDRLGLSEKLNLVEDIWDSIAASDADLPVHEWQKTELDRRYRDFQAGNVELRDWKSAHKDFRKKYS